MAATSEFTHTAVPSWVTCAAPPTLEKAATTEAIKLAIAAMPDGKDKTYAEKGHGLIKGACGHQMRNCRCLKRIHSIDLTLDTVCDDCAQLEKAAAKMVRKTRMVEETDDHCPHCDHQFHEKGYPRPHLPDDEDERRKVFKSGDYDEHCPSCGGIVDADELTDEEISSSWGGEAIHESLRKRRDVQRRRRESREKSASAVSRSIRKARNATDTSPTLGQIEAGNYRKGALSFHGIPVKIENPDGTTRRGVGGDGKAWQSIIHGDYGYFTGTKAIDGDAVDVFLGPDHDAEVVVAIDQYNGSKFDETKFVTAVTSKEQGEKLYLSNYPKGWRLGPSRSITLEQLKLWLKHGNHKKPFKEQMLKAAALVGRLHRFSG